MSALFADTFFYLALASRNDAAHLRAVALSKQLTARTITTAWVLTETADALADPRQRPVFLTLLDTLQSDPRVTIIPPTQSLFQQGIALYEGRPDKE